MATTSAFGWETPDDTDLVKDGAAAIRTLGNSIDTSMSELKGGTTGQVLSKTSGTDMDFTWVAPATVATSYGYAAGKNAILNGDFRINQRAFTSSTSSGAYTFDRWTGYSSSGTTTISTQAFTPGTAPVSGYEAINFLRCVTSGQTGTGAASIIEQRIEDVRTLSGQTATMSFWAKANTGTPKIYAELSQNFGSGGSATVNITGGQVTLSTSWARYSVTFTVPSMSGKTIGTSSFLDANLWVSAGTDFNSRTNSLGIQNNTFDIWGVQLEAGSSATAFQTATGTIQGELAACQRYYWRLANGSNSAPLGMGSAYSSTAMYLVAPMPVTMRTVPSFSISNSAAVGFYSGGSSFTSSAVALDGIPSTSTYAIAVTFSGMTAGRVGHAIIGGNYYLELSAEL